MPAKEGSGRVGFWQRRYLLRHYREMDDAVLAAGSGLSRARVAEFLARHGAVRSAADLRRVERRGSAPAPTMVTLQVARRALTRLTSRPLTRLDALLIGALGVASLLLYALTCARTVTGEDAGEFLAAAHVFGVPHPPGYPLWLMLAWLADHAVPLVSTVWRVAMVSAIFAAAANAVLLAIALKSLRYRVAAVTAAAMFAVSRTHWTQAVIPEVYGLNTFFIALQVLLLVRLAERPTAGRFVALAAITGLSATNHTSALPMALVFAAGAAFVAPQLLRSPRTLILAVVAGLLPLLVYLVLPLASAREPYIDWGNPETFADLWSHATRAQYAGLEAGKTAAFDHGDYLRRLAILGDWACQQFGSGWVLLLAILGAILLFVRQTGLWLLLAGLGWLSSVGITRYTAFPFEREHVYANQIFWIPAWLVTAWFLGGGIDTLLSLADRVPGTAVRRVATAAVGVACAGLVAFPANNNFARSDRSRTTAIAHFGRAILDAMEPGALYFPTSDHSTFSVMFWQGVEGHRLDVTLADKYGRVEPSVLDSVLTPEERNVRIGLSARELREFEEQVLMHKWNGPVYFANRREMGADSDLVLEPVGPVFQVMRPEQARAWWLPGADGVDPPGLRIWSSWLPLLEIDERQRLDITVQMIQGDLLYMRGYALLRAGRLDEALACWSKIHGDLAPLKQAYNNIGAALAENQQLAKAVEFFEMARQEDPRYVLALRNEALVLRNLGDTARAIELLQHLAGVAPGERVARLQLAHLLDEADRPLDALAEFERLAAEDASDAEPWRQAGHLLRKRGDAKKAEDAYVEALRLDPELSDCSDWLDRLRRGVGEDDASAGVADREVQPLETLPTVGGPPPPSLPRLPGIVFDPAWSIGSTLPR